MIGRTKSSDQQCDIMRIDVATWVWTKQVRSSTVCKEWEGCEMKCDAEDKKSYGVDTDGVGQGMVASMGRMGGFTTCGE